MPQDVIFYYAKVFPKLKEFLGKREIATKTKLKDFEVLKRGSNKEPLYIDELVKGVNKKFLELRKGNTHLKDVREKLTKTQIKIWEYFVPRKLIEMHYAVNHEGKNKPLWRIYFDIDRKDLPAEKAQKVALALIKIIIKDKTFNKFNKIFPLWTGNSFHIYVLLKKPISHAYYEKYIHIDPKNPESSFTGRWIKQINMEFKEIAVSGGHEKEKGRIIIDPSQSPSGKIGRAPFSLYIKNYSSPGGYALPLSINDLENRNLIKELRSYTQEEIIRNIDNLAKNLA